MPVGGLGTLGQLVTRWLQQQSASDIVLLGRSGHAADAAGFAASSASTSGAVSIVKADISLAADLAPLLLPTTTNNNNTCSSGSGMRGENSKR